MKGSESMIYQVAAPLLDACVLAILVKEDTYGYVLTKKIQEVIGISESTLYPVLRRMQKNMCLATYDKQEGGRNRRYYSITDKGKETFDFFQSEWIIYKKQIDLLLGGNENE